MRLASLVFLLLLFAGCGLFESDEGTVEVRTQAESIIVSNETGKTIHYSVFDRDILALINWAPCTDVNLSPGHSVEIQFSDVWMYEPGHDLVVYWWHLPKRGGCADEMHTIVVEI